MAANNPSLRAITTLASLRVDSRGSMQSDRIAPTTVPSAQTNVAIAILATNGRRVVTPQQAKVAYLPETEKMQIPSKLFAHSVSIAGEKQHEAKMAYNTLLFLAGDATIPAADRYVRIRNTGPGSDYPGSMEEWEVEYAALDPTKLFRVDVSVSVGSYDVDGRFTQRVGVTDESEAYVKFKYGTDPLDELVIGRLLDAEEASPTTPEEVLRGDDAFDQLSDSLSPLFGLNYSIIDYGALRKPNMTWDDNECQTRKDASRYIVNLAPYTIGMLAALNLKALGGTPRLAWCRAYGVAMGLLPSATSLHHVEYTTTDFLSDDAELRTVLSDHPSGEEGQIYVRGCFSLGAAFGMMHLANDHTYKDNDDILKRKGSVAIRACRTTLRENEAEKLASGALLKIAIRTTFHPFGLSSMVGCFLDGQQNHLLAEPLQIRDSTVPPIVAKVGLVIAIMTKIFALPIGSHFRRAFGTACDEIDAMKKKVVGNATAYSGLHKHYGVATMLTLTSAEERVCKSFMPMISGYCLIFELDERGQPAGGALSQSVNNCIRDSGGIVEMYRTAFESYRDKGANLMELVTSATSGDLASQQRSSSSAVAVV